MFIHLKHIKMNSKHLTKGDPCPPLVNGKLRIYSMRFCPYAQRALLVAAAKKIPYDIVNVNLTAKPEFIFEKNPGGKVPTIETPAGTLYESLVVSDYMDEAYPDQRSGGDGTQTKDIKLNSIDPYQKALDRILVENFSKIVPLDYQIFYPGPEVGQDEVNNLLKQLYETLIPFEKELARRGTQFFGGDARPGMLDYMIWPWMERLPVHELLYKNKFNFENAKKDLKLLNAWEELMKKDPAVLESFVTPKIHMEYRLSKKPGATIKYDILLTK